MKQQDYNQHQMQIFCFHSLLLYLFLGKTSKRNFTTSEFFYYNLTFSMDKLIWVSPLLS